MAIYLVRHAMMKSERIKRLFLLTISLLLVELILGVASWTLPVVQYSLAPPWERDKPTIADSLFGFRGNPLFPDHDESGYRNEFIPRRANAVTLGDSQTYGTSVDREATWPRLVSNQSGLTVYNMALGGYGPGHYLLQLEDALRQSPQLIIVAFYFGNDLYDAFSLSHRVLTIAELATSGTRAAAQAVEAKKPLANDVNNLFNRGQKQVDQAPSIRRWLSDNSKLYGLLRALRYALGGRNESSLLSKNFDNAVAALTETDRLYSSVVEADEWRTILTAPYRGRVLDDTDPRIRMGFEISQASLLAIKRRLKDTQVRLAVLLLPTKENVFWARVKRPDEQLGLASMVANENRLRAELIAILQNHDIQFLNLLEPLRAAPHQPYFEDADGHPNEVGHQVIADQVVRWLKVAHSTDW